MANIDEDDEDTDEEDDTTVEIEPPKRKAIATLKVWGHCDRQFTVQSVSKHSCQLQKNDDVNCECISMSGETSLNMNCSAPDYMAWTVLPVKLPVSHTVPN